MSALQQTIASHFNMKATDIARDPTEIMSAEQVSMLIDLLHPNCAPGVDRMSTEHLKHGKSAQLCIMIIDSKVLVPLPLVWHRTHVLYNINHRSDY